MGIQLEVVKYLPDYESWENARIGAFSRTNEDDNIKYLIEKFAMVDTEQSIVETPTYFVARELRGLSFAKTDLPDIKIPQYAVPCVLPKAAYIDIRSAYLSIAKVLGAEVVFKSPHKVSAIGEYVFDSPVFDHKIARALILSCTVKEMSTKIWKKPVLETIKFPNRMYAPHLQFGIKAVLQSIAYECLPHIAYFNTDGMIAPIFSLHRVESILRSWGLEFSIKETGNCVINGASNYAFNSTKPPRKNYGKYSNLVNIEGIKEQWLKIVSLRY